MVREWNAEWKREWEDARLGVCTSVSSKPHISQFAGCPELVPGVPLRLSARPGARATLGLVDAEGRLLTTFGEGASFCSGQLRRAVLMASWRGWTQLREIQVKAEENVEGAQNEVTVFPCRI